MLIRLLLALSAAVMLFFALPGLVSSTWVAIGTPIRQNLVEGKPVSGDDITTALALFENSADTNNLPLAYFYLASLRLQTATTVEEQQAAIDAAYKAVDASPSRMIFWHNLASILSYFPERHEDALTAWRAARELGPHENWILLDRLRVGITLYANMSVQDQQSLRTDLEGAYAFNRGRLRQYGRQMQLLEWFKFLLRDPEKTTFLNS